MNASWMANGLTLATIVHRVKGQVLAFLGEADQRQQDIELHATQSPGALVVAGDNQIEDLVLVRCAQSTARQDLANRGQPDTGANPVPAIEDQVVCVDIAVGYFGGGKKRANQVAPGGALGGITLGIPGR